MKKIRQINYLVISLVKPLLSRNFSQKCVKVKFQNFHSVCYLVWNFQDFSVTQILREIKTVLIKAAILTIFKL